MTSVEIQSSMICIVLFLNRSCFWLVLGFKAVTRKKVFLRLAWIYLVHVVLKIWYIHLTYMKCETMSVEKKPRPTTRPWGLLACQGSYIRRSAPIYLPIFAVQSKKVRSIPAPDILLMNLVLFNGYLADQLLRKSRQKLQKYRHLPKSLTEFIWAPCRQHHNIPCRHFQQLRALSKHH